MSIDAIRQRISVINAETARLNTQRNQNIGKREALQKQLTDAFALYEKNYGVKLTEETLQTELVNVTRKKEEELRKIEQILSLINAGDIAGANKLAGVEDAIHTVKEVTQSASDVVSEFMQAKPPVSEGVYTGIPQVPEKTEILEPITAPPTVNGGNTQVVEPVAPPVVPPVVAPVIETPVTPPVIEPVAPPSQPKPPVLTGAESLDMGMSALEGFTKPALGSIAPPPSAETVAPPKTQVQDFGAILNGTAFKPQ